MRTLLGLFALLFYLLHAGNCVRLGRGEEALWACHVATAAIAFGLLIGVRSCVAVGCYCLTIGTPLWAAEATLGGDVLPTSFGTHVGGLALGLGWLGPDADAGRCMVERTSGPGAASTVVPLGNAGSRQR